MNKEKTAVLVDSGADVPEEWVKKYDIRVVRLKISFRGKMYSDGLDITPDMVYEGFREEIPRTSTPNAYEVGRIISRIREDGYEKIIGVSISSAMSSTYANMKKALEEAEGIRTYIFDTRNISIGAGVYAMYAAKLLAEGKRFEEVCGALEKKKRDSHIGYYMDTLDYLKAGGRITPSVALAGKVLHIKPIISCNAEGVYYTAARALGKSKALAKLVDVVVPEGIDIRNCWVFVMNGAGEEIAEQAKRKIRERYPDVSFTGEGQIHASMAIHTGPGLVGIEVFALTEDAYPRRGLLPQAEQLQEKILEAAQDITEDLKKKLGK